MTKIARRSLMYATVSGCAQAPVVRDTDQDSAAKTARGPSDEAVQPSAAASKTKPKSE